MARERKDLGLFRPHLTATPEGWICSSVLTRKWGALPLSAWGCCPEDAYFEWQLTLNFGDHAHANEP